MGICKHKKKTDLFCFVHKKAVCENCILEDHQTCIVKTYVDWLTDSEYDLPSCGVCHGELVPDKVVRLLCLDMFHPECLEVHAKSLPSNTAKAGYLCPTCAKPIFPSDPDSSSPLVRQLQKYLTEASWSKTLMVSVQSHSIVTPTYDVSPADLESGNIKRQTTDQSQDSFGIASRKYKEPSIQDDEEEDKYKKRSITQLFVALGLMKPTPASGKKKRTRVRLDLQRVLILFALTVCLITVISVLMSLTTEGETTTDEVQ
eukprot:TRINITY_DN2601_c0_g1_i1.p1 TRINITY_DN2601_c0_g1~~TRINITY_DN2601_c0_g1_i1.p1  ORF type:complete len:259 (-),score=49.89 TRINITY_DN2601_c0_g1_i1:22-798(-)